MNANGFYAFSETSLFSVFFAAAVFFGLGLGVSFTSNTTAANGGSVNTAELSH